MADKLIIAQLLSQHAGQVDGIRAQRLSQQSLMYPIAPCADG
jgi:hypothetical protein